MSIRWKKHLNITHIINCLTRFVKISPEARATLKTLCEVPSPQYFNHSGASADVWNIFNTFTIIILYGDNCEHWLSGQLYIYLSNWLGSFWRYSVTSVNSQDDSHCELFISLQLTPWACCELFVRSPWWIHHAVVAVGSLWELQTHRKPTASSSCEFTVSQLSVLKWANCEIIQVSPPWA